jgi:hypothetical protein
MMEHGLLITGWGRGATEPPSLATTLASGPLQGVVALRQISQGTG